MKQAEKFKRPIICFVDTLGADPSMEAEANGQNVAIANNLMEILMLEIPIISIFIGYGCSGGAMAFAIANEVIFLENAFLSVLSPKGCAKLLWNDSTRGDEAAKILKITAGENKEWGFVDRIVCEPVGGAHMNKEMVFDNVKSILEEVLCKYERMTGEQVKIERYQQYRKLGNELFDCYSE